MKEHVQYWYAQNQTYVDHIMNILISNLKQRIRIPKTLSYNFMFDWDAIRDDMIEYLYNSQFCV